MNQEQNQQVRQSINLRTSVVYETLDVRCSIKKPPLLFCFVITEAIPQHWSKDDRPFSQCLKGIHVRSHPLLITTVAKTSK